jgi:FG-GAP repeat
MSFVSTYNSASIRGWEGENQVGAKLQFITDLSSPTIANNAQFGSHTSLSGNGEFMSIGSQGRSVLIYNSFSSVEDKAISDPRINESGNVWIGHKDANVGGFTSVGSVEIYTANANWTLTQTLLPSVILGFDNFGRVSAMDGTGDTIVTFSQSGGSPSGYIYLYTFVKSGNTYAETQRLTLSGPSYPSFGEGFPVSLSGDGNILAVGSTFTGGLGAAQYTDIFTRTGSTYTYQTRLFPLDGVADDGFGRSTSLNYDGSILLVGAGQFNVGNGAAYVFNRTGSSWSQAQKIISPKSTVGDQFGESVCISSDSSALIIGAPFEDTGGNNRGSSFVYFNINNTFYYAQELSGTANNEFFGSGVAISNSLNYVTLVGAQGADYSGRSDVGRAYVYSAQIT